MELAGKLGLLTEQLAQLLLVLLPVCDRSTCNATVHSSLGYCCRNLCNQTWVNWLWNEVLRTECKVVYVVNIIDYIRYRLLCQISDSMNGSHLHLFVDGACVNVERTTEDVWETNYIINLVRIV